MDEDKVLEFLETPEVTTATETTVAGETMPPAADKTPEPVQPAAEKPEHAVPLSTFLDMRDENKRLKAQLERAAPPQEFEIPDPRKDPVGHAQYLSGRAEITALNDRLNFSEKLAVKEYGQEEVDKVREWCLGKFEEDEAFAQRILGNADPYEAAKKAYDRETLTKDFDNPEHVKSYREWLASRQNGGSQPSAPKSAAAVTSAASPQPAAKRAPPPPSINSAPSATGKQGTAVGEGVAFDSIFK